jgi:hypothetical protein
MENNNICLNTFGKNKADICLVEELIISNDDKERKFVSKTLARLSKNLKPLNYISDKCNLQTICDLLKEKEMNIARESDLIKSDKVRSFLLNSINGKVNDVLRKNHSDLKYARA